MGQPPQGPVPPELGNLSRLNALHLSGTGDNDLEGPIPPEIANLTLLGGLSIVSDKLTGPIPPQLGSLDRLTWLTLGGKNLTGPLPGTFVQLTRLEIVSISLCVPGTPEWIPWAGRIRSLDASFCNGADVGVLGLFYDATGGPDWTNQEGWGQGSISEWYGVKTDSIGLVVGLELSDNGLTGRLPSNLGQLTQLKELSVDGNELSGPLPLSLTARALTRFHYADTNLCAPADDMFREWLASIESHEGTGEECELSERDILEALFAATGGSNWARNENWNSDQPLGEWYGVSVDEGGRVTEVVLGSNGLTGLVPAELGALANLRRLDLRRNELSGSIPARLSNLTQIRSVQLGDNALTGPVPPELGTLVQLRILVLRNNDLTGPIPPELGNLVNVQWFFLHGNELTGPIPPELGKLAEVNWLDLSNNGLTGSIPIELGNLPRIGRLHLDGNELSGPVPAWLGSLSTLGRLSLGGNQFTGPIPRELENLTNLTELSLWDNPLTGEIPAWLGNLGSLESLWLARNDLTGTIPPEFGNLVNLRELVIYENDLVGPLPAELGNLRNLQTLSIGSTGLSGPIPAEFVNLPLVRFLWRNTNLCSPTDREFQDWLASLQVNQGEEPCVRDALAALYHAAGGDAWANNANWLTDEPVADWYGVVVDEQGLPVSINLRDNRLEGSITAEIAALSSLQQLDLSQNQLSGEIPSEVGKLTDLQLLDLGENRLTGALPAGIGELAQLRLLDLGANELTDHIPDALGRLTRLETLDISGNGFTGSLPGSLADLTGLTSFSWNDSGVCAPDVTWFQTWLGSIAQHTPGENCAADPLLLGVPSVHLTQAAQSLGGDVPLIARRPALLRVFATADRASAYQPPARATLYLNDSEVHTVLMELESERGLPLSPRPGDLTQSYSAGIPGEILTPGVEMVIEVDPDSIVPRAAGSTVRVPAEGRLTLDVREMPRLDLTIVPVLFQSVPDSSVLDWADNFASGEQAGGFVRHVLPVDEWDVNVREPYFTTSDPQSLEQWRNLLREIRLVRTMDSGAGYYYGVMEPTRRSGILGVGGLPGTSSVGLPDPTVLAHELGHNLSLRHTPCGLNFDADPNYPYADGEIGVWGYDARADSLISSSIPDVMGGGCDPAWISDYHFKKALEYRAEAAEADTRARVTAREPRLLLWGGIDPGGELHLDPAFMLQAPEKVPTRGGPYRLEGFGPAGETLFSLDFGLEEVEHGGGDFLFTIPFEDDWRGSLHRIVLSGPEGTTMLDGESDMPMAIFVDRVTGRIRGSHRGADAPGAAAVAANLGRGLAADPDLEIRVSHGLPWRVPK
ncbi:leucine-rich repeat domain-containing protein [Candidatus Palauibacter sp.]|uniref:leucine-rich repeat domain-containing protein n=1 Tax=Candidatus Palauibacter sp. TaxID=3101350 RepID=UPI003B5B2B62